MEFSLSGNALKTLNRSIPCLAKIGNELVIQASASQLILHSLNASRSAYQSVTFKADFFDVYALSADQVKCSVLLKAVSSVLRTPVTSIDRLCVFLPNSDAAKVQWTLDCHNGVRKAYWITCNVEPDIQHLSLDRRKFPSNFVVGPRDLNRLLANFQSSLQEITIIATEPTSLPSDCGDAIGGKSVELRSYIDPTKENSDALHTQLWIDPSEEFLQYTHAGDAVDVTFSMKELKAFLSFCEGCEVDMHLFFEKAGEPILMAPRFGMNDGINSDFDAALVLATMLMSQLREANTSEHPPAALRPFGQVNHGIGSQAWHPSQTLAGHGPPVANQSHVSEHPSDHTKIWSDLSGSAARSSDVVQERHVQPEGNPNTREHSQMQQLNMMEMLSTLPARENAPDRFQQPMETNQLEKSQGLFQHHPSNWVSAADDNEEDDEEEIYVQSTPQI